MAAIFMVNTSRFRASLEQLHRKLNLKAEQTKLVLAGRGLEMHSDGRLPERKLAFYDFVADEWHIVGLRAAPKSEDEQVPVDSGE